MTEKNMKQIFIKIQGGESMKLVINPNTTGKDIKTMISTKNNIPVDAIDLWSKNIHLMDEENVIQTSSQKIYILARINKIKNSVENEKHERVLCKNDCGFYGDLKNGGYCSVCYKEEYDNNEVDDDEIEIESSSASSASSMEEEIKEENKKCDQCKKRLNYISFTCECKKTFCIKDRYPHQHNCTYDHSTKERKRLHDQLESQKVIPNKIQKI